MKQETVLTKFDVADFLERQQWKFAETYAAFCPHEYIVYHHLDGHDREIYFDVVRFIRDNGCNCIYGRHPMNQYYVVGDWYYWTMSGPIEEQDVLNRAKISDYIFYEDLLNMFVRYRRRNEPVQNRDETLEMMRRHTIVG